MLEIQFNTSNAGNSLRCADSLASTLDAKNGDSRSKIPSFLMPLLVRISGMFLVLFLLPSCANVDPNFSAYEPQMLSNPKPDAILGMWHHKNKEGWLAGNTTSLLFKTDGTAYAYNSSGSNAFAPFHATGTWLYEGGGWWGLRFKDAPVTYRCRTDGKHMLSYGSDPTMVHKIVYSRPDQN
jgi:hypothetical protein